MINQSWILNIEIIHILVFGILTYEVFINFILVCYMIVLFHNCEVKNKKRGGGEAYGRGHVLQLQLAVYICVLVHRQKKYYKVLAIGGGILDFWESGPSIYII